MIFFLKKIDKKITDNWWIEAFQMLLVYIILLVMKKMLTLVVITIMSC